MRKFYFGVLFSALIAAPLFAQQQQKRRVAVLDFGYGTVTTSVQALFGTNQDVGKGISDLLIDRLINDGTYRVIERREINNLQDHTFYARIHIRQNGQTIKIDSRPSDAIALGIASNVDIFVAEHVLAQVSD